MTKLPMRGAGFLACSALFFLSQTTLQSHDAITTKLTWTREISRIVYKRCGSCHHAGSLGIDLSSYGEVRPWAKAIRDEVLSRRMPPWGAVQGIRDLVGDPSLSQPETDMLIAWVEGGAPEGDPDDLPAHLPAFKMDSQAQPHSNSSVTVVKELTLTRAVSIVALRPKDLADGDALEAWAVKPDGTVERLLWLTNYRGAWARTYVLTTPLQLPAGTRLRVAAKTGMLTFLIG